MSGECDDPNCETCREIYGPRPVKRRDSTKFYGSVRAEIAEAPATDTIEARLERLGIDFGNDRAPCDDMEDSLYLACEEVGYMQAPCPFSTWHLDCEGFIIAQLIDLVEGLQCCGNCGSTEPGCRYMSAFEKCHFTPSRWVRR